MNDSYVFRNKLIFVMGLQRSGTSALLEALGQDPRLHIEPERPDGPLYDRFYLRPEPEVRRLLWAIPRRVALKPISEVQRRSVQEALDEFASYGVTVVWIYRDPVNVWWSTHRTLEVPESDYDDWARLWNAGNESVLEALAGRWAGRIVVVRYEDLINNRETFELLCRRLNLRPGTNLFWREDAMKGRQALSAERQHQIERDTAMTLARLDAVRIRTPHWHDWLFGADDSGRVEGGSRQWKVYQHGQTLGHLQFPPALPGMVRLEISNPSEREALQLEYGPWSLRAERTYTLSVWARADSARRMGWFVGPARPPWGLLSGYHEVEIGPEWRSLRLEFTTAADELAVRALFDVGQDDVAIELTEPRLLAGSADWNQLESHGVQAAIEFDPARPRALTVRPAADVDASQVQLITHRFRLVEGEAYSVGFTAQAESTRAAAIAVSRDGSPWETLGLYERFDVGPRPQVFRFDFEASASAAARGYFNLGESAIGITVGEVSFFRRDLKRDSLFLHDDCVARFSYLPESPERVRIEIDTLGDRNPTSVQFARTLGPIERGRRYGVEFTARADMPRPVGFGVCQRSEPWANLGIYRDVHLTPHWETWHFEFTALADDPRATVKFDVGKSDVRVELDTIRIELMPASLNPNDAEAMRRAADAQCEFTKRLEWEGI